MLYRLYSIEKEIIYTLTVFLILFNLVSLYFIIDLLSYDEIIDYLTDDEIKNDSRRILAYLLFVSGMSNLLFVTVSLISRLLSE
ncbi:hypothetical protein OIU80_11350 [Flavobacterium sp. LS1R47]|uniref:Uncharacterized protein n=1 Tax=Flavobacterium frigoritolerans TaxID=2987686 RepID=A0A9X2ZNV3_9FLAO|nr:hypothetical protein [Flavobacterium frigoritolerans]MCV9932880.1 hypothetical protein [Flavobacterium frigoritolerans]